MRGNVARTASIDFEWKANKPSSLDPVWALVCHLVGESRLGIGVGIEVDSPIVAIIE